MSAAYLRASAKLSVETKGGEGDHVTSREENSALAKALAIAPEEPDGDTMGCFGSLFVLVAIGAFIWGGIAGKWFEGDGAPRFYGGDGDLPLGVEDPSAYLGWISAASLVLGPLLLALSGRAVRVWRRRTGPGRVAADRLWAEAWYCGRCGVVHFTGERAMSLQEFRTRVWSAGGYGDLAVRHPAV
ncbi:hypothetical protein ACODT5_21155 [Streptomyces sp. 5.8]|uniref:hypothetical protein n=1 Tax=Streptomyces sp. 5.8 TaxID=3406571 RepID=UPI003BB5A3EB